MSVTGELPKDNSSQENSLASISAVRNIKWLDGPLGMGPFETTVLASWVGCGLGFLKEFKRPQFGNHFNSACRSAGVMGGRFGAFVGLYHAGYLGTRYARGLLDDDATDVPSATVGGALAFAAFSLPLGLHAASVSLFQGAFAGFAFGSFQLGTQNLIQSIETGEASNILTASAPDIECAPDTHGAENLARSLDDLAKRMADSASHRQISPAQQPGSQQQK